MKWPDNFQEKFRKIKAIQQNLGQEETQNFINSIEEGGIFAQQGNLDLAEFAFLRALEQKQYASHSALSFIYYNLGGILFKQNQLEGAENMLKISLKIKQDEADVWLLLGEVYEKTNFSQALNSYRTASIKNPKLDIAFIRLSRLLRENKNFDEALRTLKKIKTIDNEVIHEFQILGEKAEESNELEVAEESYETIVSMSNLPSHLVNIGSFYYKIKHYEQAEKSLKRAQLLAPDDFSSWFILAKVYKSSGRVNDAIEALENALRRNSNFADGYYELGLIYSDNSPQKTIEFWKKYLQLQPNTPQKYQIETYISTKASHLEKGILESSIKISPQIHELDPGNSSETSREQQKAIDGLGTPDKKNMERIIKVCLEFEKGNLSSERFTKFISSLPEDILDKLMASPTTKRIIEKSSIPTIKSEITYNETQIREFRKRLFEVLPLLNRVYQSQGIPFIEIQKKSKVDLNIISEIVSDMIANSEIQGSVDHRQTIGDLGDDILYLGANPEYSCEICKQTHERVGSYYQCNDCNRFICSDCYREIKTVGLTTCPSCGLNNIKLYE